MMIFWVDLLWSCDRERDRRERDRRGDDGGWSSFCFIMIFVIYINPESFKLFLKIISYFKKRERWEMMRWGWSYHLLFCFYKYLPSHDQLSVSQSTTMSWCLTIYHLTLQLFHTNWTLAVSVAHVMWE